MTHSRLARRASATAKLLLALALLGLLAVVAFLFLRIPAREGAAAVAAPVAAAPVSPSAGPDASSAEETSAVRGVVAQSTGGLAASVRLEGNGRLTGKVLERESGAGVGGVQVQLLPLPPAASAAFGRALRLAGFGSDAAQQAAAVAVTSSAGDGVFAFEGLRPGAYFVDARGPGHVPDAAVQARVTPSNAGGDLEVWVRRGGRVVGKVELPDGSPAAGVGVALRPGLEELLDRARNGEVVFLEAHTDAAGEFVIAGVPPADTWAVAAFGRGFALTREEPVAVRAGEDTQITIRARTGGVLRGRTVTGEGLSSEITPGVAVAGAHVGVVPHGLRDLVFIEHLLQSCYDVSDKEGRFEMDHVPPGEVDLVAWAPGHLPTIGASLMVSDGGEQEAADLALDGGPRIEGRVVDSAGQPIAGASLRWDPIDFEEFNFAFSFAPFLTQAIEGFAFPRTDADGRFVAGAFPGEPPYEIQVSKPGFAEVSHAWTPGAGPEPIEIVLHRGGAVEGIVMDGSKRAPLSSFTVSSGDQIAMRIDMSSGDNPFTGGTLIEDPQGRFRIEPLEPGSTNLKISAPGFIAQRTDDLTIVEGETVYGVIVTLQPGAVVRGEVFDQEGQPVAGALVFWAQDAAQDETAESRRWGKSLANDMPAGFREYAAAMGFLGDATAVTAPDGSFELTGVEPGRVVVYASHRTLASGMSVPVAVLAGQTIEGVEVELTRGAQLHGIVRDRFDRPVPGVLVLAVSPTAMDEDANGSSGLVYQGFTNSAGHYEIARMAGGGYFVMTARGDAALDPLSLLGSLNFELVTVPTGERVEHDLVDTSIGATRVTGVVHDGGEPLMGGNLVAMGLESESLLGLDIKVARIRANGTFLFEGLAAGEYRFQISEGRTHAGETIDDEVRMSVEIPDQPEVHLELALPGGEISGVVVDAETGAPVKDAALALLAIDAPKPGGLLGGMMGSASTARASTGENGVFSFPRLEAGRYRMEAGPPRWGEQRDRYAPIEPLEIRLREGEREANLEIRLKPSLALTGTVRNEAGEPIAKAQIRGTRAGVQSALSASTRSGDDGRFTLRGLAPGTWTLTISIQGYAPATREGVEIAEGKQETVDLVLARGVTVRVLVEDSAGLPASGAAARLTPVEGSGAGDAGAFMSAFFGGRNTSDSSGRIELGNFKPGLYRLEVQRGLLRAPPREVELTGNEVELRARLP